MLFIVPTPIGNLKDITLRAIETLKGADIILAEDTRVTGKLLNHLQIEKPLWSFHSHNEHKAIDGVMEKLEEGLDIALVSDAGTPGISDPGFLLSRACKEKGIKISCLPGPTAFVPALVASGIPCDKFHMEGFLPQKKGRQTRLKYLAGLENTFILYESPHRLIKCLEQLTTFCGPERDACVARELSKIHEEITTDTLESLIQYYKNKASVKGEIVIIVAGKE